MKIKHYGMTIALLYIAVVVTAIVGAFNLQPFYGDLTRIGGFAENDYGWNTPQQKIVSPVDSVSVQYTPEARERTTDIWVFGDSFSHFGMEMRTITPDDSIAIPPAALNNWTDWLSAMTGRSVLVFHIEYAKLDELLNSQQFQRSPPELLIYQSIERQLKSRAARFADENCKQNSATADYNLAGLSSHAVETQPIARPVNTGSLNFTGLFHQIKTRIKDKDEVRKYTLNSSSLFSSHKSNSLLIYRRDLKKNTWTSSDVETIRCSFSALKRRIEANGKTRFLALAIPDKSTVYQHYAPELTIEPNVIEFESELPATVPIVHKLIDAVDGGAIDVYLPNDTHFGYYGHRLVAESVIDYLNNKRHK